MMFDLTKESISKGILRRELEFARPEKPTPVNGLVILSLRQVHSGDELSMPMTESDFQWLLDSLKE